MEWHKWKNTVLTFLIVAICVGCVFIIYDFKGKKSNIKLGLDLRSGSHIAVQLIPVKDPTSGKMREIDDRVINNTMQIIDKRINPDGTREVLIQREGADRIIIEIPEETNLMRAEKMIRQSAYLEFKEQYYNPSKKSMDWRTVLDGKALASADEGFGSGGSSLVSFSLTKEGAKEFARITERNVGKPLGIFVDGKLIDAPNVREPITGGAGEISGGSLDIDKCKELADMLNSGALPVKTEILESTTVSPVLGEESLRYSLIAGMIGLGLVIIYMIIYYLVPGALANLALIIYTLVLLASMVLGKFVLTLPGIAGLILSIGMAVDANILIFERLKEELWSEKSIRSSVEAGFKRAFSSILDSHVTTFLGAMVLYVYGSQSIKGFGLTLMLGTAWSLITAVFVTRVLVDDVVDNNLILNRKFYGA